MRWKAKRKLKIDANRVVTRFLLIPRCIDGVWRWLEIATIRQVRESRYRYGYPRTVWANKAWLDIKLNVQDK